ncbi:MAG: endonuclease/exonuclease/phosphatase family metal-dependent hydrolase [Rhodothermales bacterium]|jgi:endonuclease/exonuclease/phosphatase family metal-dependent hydrolase
MRRRTTLLIWSLLSVSVVSAQVIGLPLEVDAASIRSGPVLHFDFDGTADNSAESGIAPTIHGVPVFGPGLSGEALQLEAGGPVATIAVDGTHLQMDQGQDFSVQFWVRTEAQTEGRFVLLSQKAFPDNSLASQKNPGWVFYTSGGTWAWSMGSGNRRITYERDNGSRMPLNDGRWHQLGMTYSSELSEVRLYYDGVNWVTYHVGDSIGFDFSSPEPMVVGTSERLALRREPLPAVVEGAKGLQTLVDAFDRFGLSPVAPGELLDLVVDPRQLFERKVDGQASRLGPDSLRPDSTAFRQRMEETDWDPITAAERALMGNPYTVHQNMNFVGTAPVSQVFALRQGKVEIRPDGAAEYAARERLDMPEFDMDELAVWNRVLAPEEVAAFHGEHFESSAPGPLQSVNSLIAACWNIWHGGKHWTLDEHGWDSRVAIADMLREADVDVVMMQETYSSGDFIAAELGFYFATTVDWDYLNQGSNISVMSRWPITEVHVDEASPFNNVGARVTASRTQDLQVMSNWYGMGQFPSVFEFHSPRFDESDLTPVLFAGDFNAIPHTDGGDSPASVTLMEAGFTDAYRSLYPNPKTHPAPTHQNGERIDQLYYRGAGLKNTSTRIVNDRNAGFPSDHYLILSTFDLDYATRPNGR